MMQVLISLFYVTILACQEKPETKPPEASPEIPSWVVVEEASSLGAFMSVWGGTDDDIWIVGGQYDQGVVLRGSQDSWNQMALPDNRVIPLLNWVHGTAVDDVWVGGLNGTILHWDGQIWTDHSIDIEEAIWGIHAVSTDQVAAVGGVSRWGGDQARVYFYDGMWTEAGVPTELSGIDSFFKVGYANDAFWCIGSAGAVAYGDERDLTPLATGFTQDLVTINSSIDGQGTVIVGGRGTGILTTLQGQSITDLVAFPAGLNGVYQLNDGRAFVVGERGYGALYNTTDSSIVEWSSATLNVLHATFVDSTGVVYAVGGNLFTSDEYFNGVILRSELK